jgi:hypothetical protein
VNVGLRLRIINLVLKSHPNRQRYQVEAVTG